MMTKPAATKQPSPFASCAAEITACGYTVIPILPRDKAPGEFVSGKWRLMAGWNKFRSQRPESFAVRLWMGYEGANIGVVLGTPAGPGMELIAIDFDTDEPATLEMMESALPPSPVRKRGARGYTAFYRGPAGLKGRRFRTANGATICEILTGNMPRQTVLPPSIHPSGKAYQWTSSDTLATIRPENLPALLDDQIERFCDTLAHLCPDAGEPVAASRGDASDDETIWARLNRAALDRLDDWVPVLNLPKLARKAGRYEAVASWRPSSTGRPLDQRKPNLSIFRDGIKDFGTDQTYSALDLLMVSQGWDFDSAFRWLSERLGMFQDQWPEIEIPEPLPSVPAEPAPPRAPEVEAPARLPGLVGDVTRWLLATARRPNPILAMGAAVTIIGTLAGRRVAGPTLSGTHLYVIGLARSGGGKDHPVKKITPLLEAANAGHLVGPGKFMSETSLVNMAIRQALCLCPMDEFGAFLGKVNHRRASSHEAGMSSFLRESWGKSFDVMVTPEWGGRKSERIEAPAISIYGVSTPEEFFTSLTGADVINGFLNRFLMLDGDARIDDRDPDLDPLTVPKALAGDLAQFYHDMTRITPEMMAQPFASLKPATVIGWSTEARAAWQGMKEETETLADNPEHGSFYRRTIEMALRLATIRTIGQGLFQMGADDFAWGWKVALDSANGMRRAAAGHMAENDRVAMRNRIERFAAKQPNGFRRRQLQQHLRCAMDSKSLGDILAQMVEAGTLLVRQPSQKPVIGRPVESLTYFSADVFEGLTLPE